MKKKLNQNNSENKINLESVNRRLDALIRVLLEIHFDKKNKFKLTAAVKAMKSSGLDRKDIAGILGKKPSDIDPLLYSKSDKKQTKSKSSGSAEKLEGGENNND